VSWIERLVETYDLAEGRPEDIDGGFPLMPICHTMQNAHIEITIDINGNFLRGTVIDKASAPTLMPCTEKSGSRSGSKPTNHPLCDSLQFLAGDFLKCGGIVTSGFAKEPSYPHGNYMLELKDWAQTAKHPSLIAILKYLEKGEVIKDLAAEKIIPLNAENQFVNEWTDTTESTPPIFTVVPNKTPQNSFIRWSVESQLSLNSKCHKDPTLWKAWIEYYLSTLKNHGLCNITGKETQIAQLHPSKLRHSGDKAKLISSNDDTGFTYRGKFTETDQACSVGFEATQKAHNALRWLIAKQGRRFGDQTIISWSTQTARSPEPLASTFELLDIDVKDHKVTHSINTSEDFAKRLGNYIAGYGTTIKKEDTNKIVILSIDSATPGRMAIRYYRELTASEFLDRIKHWHESCAWHQFFGKDKQFVGAPSPKDIAQAAYGKRLDTKDKLLGTSVNRLLPCIIDSAKLPRDFVDSCIRQASNPISMEPWERQKTLGIACSLYRKYHYERKYKMIHEESRNTRDYLYGSLLAIADHIEERALFLGKENRDTNAMKLMQRFAERPCSTWRNIALALPPYLSRLKAQRGILHNQLIKRLDDIYARFEASDFEKDIPLSGEFLLGFHTVRKLLWDESTQQNEHQKH